MTKKLTPEKVKMFLSNVGPDKSFYLWNGPALGSVEEFYSALGSMSDEQFSYHRNGQKNDFYKWVIGVIGDTRLANEIARAKTRGTTMKKVKERLEYLKKMTEVDKDGK